MASSGKHGESLSDRRVSASNAWRSYVNRDALSKGIKVVSLRSIAEGTVFGELERGGWSLFVIIIGIIDCTAPLFEIAESSVLLNRQDQVSVIANALEATMSKTSSNNRRGVFVKKFPFVMFDWFVTIFLLLGNEVFGSAHMTVCPLQTMKLGKVLDKVEVSTPRLSNLAKVHDFGPSEFTPYPLYHSMR